MPGHSHHPEPETASTHQLVAMINPRVVAAWRGFSFAFYFYFFSFRRSLRPGLVRMM
jgi:hypothetical protein